MIGRLLDILSTQLVRINGASMEPAIAPGSWVRVSRRAYRKRQPERFDIVRLEEPGRAGHMVVKRIVGLPGEEVRLEDGALYVNGALALEPHTRSDAVIGKSEWWPRDDEFVVLGDNRGASADSRKFGVVMRGAIRGKVMR
jgi:signal peptidase I